MQQAKQPGVPPDRHVIWRLLTIHRLIKEKRYPNTRTLSEELECSRRTAERYIEKLKIWLAAEIAYDPVRRGYYYVGGTPEFPPLRLTEGEAVAIFLAEKLLRQCRGTPYEREVCGALDKLTALLPDEVTVDACDMVGWITFDVEPLRGDEQRVAQVFADLDRARAAQRTVWMEYYTASRDAHTQREIDPYGLHLYDGVWYVIGHCHLRGKVLIFALDRIGDYRLTDKTFTIPADFDLRQYLSCGFRIERGEPRDVVIRFASEQARYIKGKQWHKSQVLEEGEDGSLVMRMRVGGLGEVKRWVLQYGAGAEVLAPPDLRQMVADEIGCMSRTYGLVEQPTALTPPG
ncbi:MAG: transcriptional regulator [Bacillota bacterium]|nr:transcriptional regulator [Bacillota bacterium]